MSNIASRSTHRQLRILELDISGEGSWPDLHVQNLSPQLNVFFGAPRTGKSSIAALMAHLMYGKNASSWRQQFAQAVSNAEGSLHLDGPRGNFVLRRQNDGNKQSRLTISSGQGDTADGQTIQGMLSGLSPQLAAKIFAVDFSESPRADWLLKETISRDLSPTHNVEASSASRSYSRCTTSERSAVDRVDSQRIDELVRRRDSIASEIEQQLAQRRSASEVLEREIGEVHSNLEAKRGHSERLRVKLHDLDAEIAALTTELRYYTLDHQTRHYRPGIDTDEHQATLSALDSEISRCRQMLNENGQREHSLRAELAQFGSDGTADRVTCLADGRATLNVLEQLLDDLDAEVSQLARAHEPGRCIGHDAHGKLSPVASLLREQVYTLCGQLTEQERIVRRQELTSESRQLSRVHTELSERLDLLLSQRESLVQRTQLASQSARLAAQPPAAGHCQCDHHGEFVQIDRPLGRGITGGGRSVDDKRTQLSALQHQHQQLADEFDTLQHEIQQLENRWEQLQSERAGLINRASIEQQQTELDRLESVIRQSLANTDSRSVTSEASAWRASDILAQLTDGKLTQIRVDREQTAATIVNRHGEMCSLESLSPPEQDQLYLALTLSLVGSYAQKGIELPLILDEPFLQQNSAQAATMLGVIAEFARDGHQVFLFTEDRDVCKRCVTLNLQVLDLKDLRQPNLQPSAPARNETPKPVVQTTNTRIIRQSVDGESTPALRLAPIEGDTNQEDEFYLTENSSLAEFPVLGAATNRLFHDVGITSVGDLLVANAITVADHLNRGEINGNTVELWQIHMVLMCYIPGLTLNDAQLLAACGICSPADLFDVEIEALQREVDSFLRSERGVRFRQSGGRVTRSRLSDWQSGARRYRDRWRRSRPRYSNWREGRSRRSASLRLRSDNRSTDKPASGSGTDFDRNKRTQKKRSSKNSGTRAPKKFYLSRHQDVEAAPSIGPKTATRLAKVGIRTVADLLNADPESTATELDVSHISAETFAEWQHQARLVCQIPGLRGYGAQLLVACGMTRPEQIAGTNADQLVAQILAYCETKEGQRILRSSDPPKVEKIAEWVTLAGQSRPLEAA